MVNLNADNHLNNDYSDEDGYDKYKKVITNSLAKEQQPTHWTGFVETKCCKIAISITVMKTKTPLL